MAPDPLPSSTSENEDGGDSASLPEGWEDASATEEAAEGTSDDSAGQEEKPTTAPRGPSAPTFKFSTFILIFLFFLGLWMLFDASARDQIAYGIGELLYPAIGVGGRYPLLTLFLAGAIQMTISAIAYNFTTDWVESAKVQAHSKAIRPLQMKAMRSGKKQHLESLKPHIDDLSARQTKMMIGQLKGMAVTWFLLIAIYTWVGMFLGSYTATGATVSATSPALYPSVNPNVTMFGTSASLIGHVWIVPLWFLVFSLYTLPLNLVLRRVLKHQVLLNRLRAEGTALGGASPPSAAG